MVGVQLCGTSDFWHASSVWQWPSLQGGYFHGINFFLLSWWKKIKRWFLYFLLLSPSLERKERENNRIHPHDTTALKTWLSYCLFVGFCGRTLLWRGWWCASLCPRLTFVESYSLSLLWSALGSVRSRPFMAILSQGVRPALTRTCEGQLTGDFWLPYRVF